MSFDSLRRHAFLYSDEDLATLLEKSAVQPSPITLREADPYFSVILSQILSGSNPLGEDPGQLGSRLRDALGLYRQS